jgi:hypothetical protein
VVDSWAWVGGWGCCRVHLEWNGADGFTEAAGCVQSAEGCARHWAMGLPAVGRWQRDLGGGRRPGDLTECPVILQNAPPYFTEYTLIWIAIIDRDPIVYKRDPIIYKIPPNLDRDY